MNRKMRLSMLLALCVLSGMATGCGDKVKKESSKTSVAAPTEVAPAMSPATVAPPAYNGGRPPDVPNPAEVARRAQQGQPPK